MSRRFAISALSLVSILSLVGCKDAWHASTQPVSGSVTVNGKPPGGAVVQLAPTGEPIDVRQTKPYGIVQEDGTFALQTYDEKDGAPIGDYKFLIHWPENYREPSSFDRLDHKYDKPETSTFSVSIKSGEATLAPIAIENAKVTMTAPPRNPSAPDPLAAD